MSPSNSLHVINAMRCGMSFGQVCFSFEMLAALHEFAMVWINCNRSKDYPAIRPRRATCFPERCFVISLEGGLCLKVCNSGCSWLQPRCFKSGQYHCQRTLTRRWFTTCLRSGLTRSPLKRNTTEARIHGTTRRCPAPKSHGNRSTELRNHRTTAPRNHGTAAPKNHGTTEPRIHGTTVPWIHRSTEA